MELPKRKPNRLPHFDYSTPGAYFLTICTQGKRNILGTIVGGGDLDAPYTALSETGRIVERYLLTADRIYGLRVDKYVIMPNHIHLIVILEAHSESGSCAASNQKIPHFVATFKRFCHRDAKLRFFQRSYHDHVIRGEADYQMIWKYIDSNPARWKEDCFYTE